MYRLPVVSGVLLALVFYPFYFWPLAFLALVPLYSFSQGEHRTRGEVFWGGCITGFIGIGPLVYYSLTQLTLFPEALLFTYLIRASSIPAILLIGVLFGGSVVAYRALRSPSLFFNSLIGASVYLAIEAVLFFVFGGYYYGSLAHAVSAFSPARAFAALGGVSLISFLIAWVSALAAEILFVWKKRPRHALRVVAYSLFIVGFLYAGLVIQTALGKGDSLRVAVIQSVPLARLTPEILHAAGEVDLLIYPFSPSDGVVSSTTDRRIGTFLAKTVSASTTVVVWNTVAERGALYDELAFWRNGEKLSYRKQELYALSDYAPWWSFGFVKSPFVISPGMESEVRINGVSVGNLICSELHQEELARKRARASAFLLAVGSDSMFPGDLSGNFSLSAARLRAAEHTIAVVRGNISGPSAIINPDGSLQSSLPFGASGILRGEIVVRAQGTTPYARWGDAPLYALAGLVIAAAALLRTKPYFKFLYRSE